MQMVMRRFAFVVSGLVLLLGLGAGSASAVTLPYYLLPGGSPGTAVTPPVGSTTYQLWVDPSAIAGSTFGVDGNFVANGQLSMTAFTGISANGTVGNLCLTATGCGAVAFGELAIISGDAINGNAVPFEIGTVTIANSGAITGGDVTLWTGDYVGSDFNGHSATTPQVIAFVAAVPEPGTLVLLGAGIGGLAVLIRRSRRS